MRAYERNGVTIDQCRDCRGIFLDRGELERLVDAEAGFYSRSSGRDRRDDDDDDDDDRGFFGDSNRYDERGRRKRRGFLDDLFDFD
jgi:Zn-finger nucleic acid-binding protein